MTSKIAQKRLLVIDDEETMRHMLSKVLGKTGYIVETASNGYEALEMIQNSDFEFILCDIKMPNMSGMDFLKAARDKIMTTTVCLH